MMSQRMFSVVKILFTCLDRFEAFQLLGPLSSLGISLISAVTAGFISPVV